MMRATTALHTRPEDTLMRSPFAVMAAMVLAVVGCTDASSTGPVSAARISSARVNRVDAPQGTSSARWNRKAIALFRARGGGPSRANTYLALAQYRAVLAAQDARHGHTRRSLAGAVAG